MEKKDEVSKRSVRNVKIEGDIERTWKTEETRREIKEMAERKE
jgi:hypothetical protein